MAEILNFTGRSKIHLDPDKVLDELKTQLLDVIVIGWNKEDRLVITTSECRASEMIYMLQLATKVILDKIGKNV